MCFGYVVCSEMRSHCPRLLARIHQGGQPCRLLSGGRRVWKGDRPVKSRPKRPSTTKAILEERAAALAVHEAKARAAGLPWRIVTACLIERHPIVIKKPEAWESDYEAMQEAIMQYGREFPKDTGLMGSDEFYEKTTEQVTKELPFKLAPRTTKADRLNDRSTLNRALDERLFLLVRHKGATTWGLPLGVWDGKQTMRQAHEGLLSSYMGPKFESFIPSNAPIGLHFTPHPDPTQHKAYGDKLFVYRSQHLRGRGSVVHPDVEEHVWVTADEIGDYIIPASASTSTSTSSATSTSSSSSTDFSALLRYIM